MRQRQRSQHTCARCGRIGYNAFEPTSDPGSAMSSWVCSHEDPCRARRRTGWRRAAANGPGRRGLSLHLSAEEGRPACVIGADPARRDLLAGMLADRTALPLTPLDLTPRALDGLARRRFCLMIIDVSTDDPIAYHNELARRLTGRAHRDLPIVLCCSDGHDRRPPLSWLAELPNVTVLRHPVDAVRFVDGVESALMRTADAGVSCA